MPGAVRQHGGRIVSTVDGDSHDAARRQIGAAARDNQVLVVLDDVDDIVARHGINTQARQVRVNIKVQRRRAGVAVNVGDRCGRSQIAVAQRRQHVSAQRQAPCEIVLYGSGVSLSTDGDGDGIARRGVRHFTRQGLARRHFSRVNDVIARQSVNGDHWQGSIDLHIMGGGRTVADAVGHGSADGVVRFAQRADR